MYGKKKLKNKTSQSFLNFKKFLHGLLHENVEEKHHWWKEEH